MQNTKHKLIKFSFILLFLLVINQLIACSSDGNSSNDIKNPEINLPDENLENNNPLDDNLSQEDESITQDKEGDEVDEANKEESSEKPSSNNDFQISNWRPNLEQDALNNNSNLLELLSYQPVKQLDLNNNLIIFDNDIAEKVVAIAEDIYMLNYLFKKVEDEKFRVGVSSIVDTAGINKVGCGFSGTSESLILGNFNLNNGIQYLMDDSCTHDDNYYRHGLFYAEAKKEETLDTNTITRTIAYNNYGFMFADGTKSIVNGAQTIKVTNNQVQKTITSEINFINNTGNVSIFVDGILFNGGELTNSALVEICQFSNDECTLVTDFFEHKRTFLDEGKLKSINLVLSDVNLLTEYNEDNCLSEDECYKYIYTQTGSYKQNSDSVNDYGLLDVELNNLQLIELGVGSIPMAGKIKIKGKNNSNVVFNFIDRNTAEIIITNTEGIVFCQNEQVNFFNLTELKDKITACTL